MDMQRFFLEMEPSRVQGQIFSDTANNREESVHSLHTQIMNRPEATACLLPPCSI